MESVAHHASTLLDFPSSRELLARFTYYDYAVFVCMLAMSGSLGLWSAWHDNRSDAKSGISLLLNGERRLPAVPVGASLMASFISAAYLLGNAAEVYRNGTLYMMTFVSYALSLAVTAHLFMPVFYRLEVMTAYEYLELRFNRAVRMAAVILYVFEMGGIKAVVLTDTFQAVVTVVAMVVVIALGMYQLGGLREVWRTSLSGGRVQFDVIDPNPTVHYTVWGLAFGSFFTNTASYATNHMMVLRYLTVPTLSKAKFVVWFNFPLLCTVLSLSSLAGLLVYVKYASCDPVAAHQISTEDQLLPYFVMDVLGKMTGVPGLFVAGIFAASLSSISSGVNALCAVSYVDIIAIIKPDIPDKIGAKIIVALGVFFGLLTIGLVGIASRMGNVLAASQVITSSIGGPLLGLFTLGMFIPCGNSKGAMTGLIVSLGFSLWINLGQFVISMALPKPSPSTDGCPAEVKNASSAVLFDGTTVLKETTNRPRDGLNVAKITPVQFEQSLAMAAALAPQDLTEDSICPNVTQNIFVVCTPSERNARAYTTVQQLRLRDTLYRVAVYPAPPDDTCKGVIRGIDLDLNDNQLRELIVTKRNPSALEVKRIKNTPAVTILFQGMQVPNYVYCGASIIRCTLFRRHTEVCYNCGNLGHRADVCPNPNTTWCRTCGLKTPPENHQCKPHCPLCGGPHPTADKDCKRKFQVPYIVRQRRRRRRQRGRSRSRGPSGASSRNSSATSSTSAASRRSRSVTPAARRRSALHSRSRSRGRSPSRQAGLTWADRVQGKQQSQRSPPPTKQVEPEKPPATPEKRASMPQVVFDCEKKAEKKKHDSSLTAVSR
ncbi:hypothetical protein HPB52_015720 [Rhipicephalus sanguineus]|uniref:CCHC-type domain-containing protein n=1 Tax=Rhipicephalus sanguineus TaxID=34632 RepID=A0A9D4Q3E3_RHISA|nr:hypothetical protein HPB52_015720 [Rhipicephalus sanguineus]